MSTKALVAEFVGTFTLVFIGVGAIAAAHVSGTSGLAGIAFAHGLPSPSWSVPLLQPVGDI